MVKVRSKDRMGREPLRQLPGKWSSDIVWTVEGGLGLVIVGAKGGDEGEGRTVLEVHLYGGAIGGFAHPDVEVFAFAGFEEEDVVAVVEVGEFVELVEFCFGVEFGVFTTVGKEGVEIIEEVAMSAGLYVDVNAILKWYAIAIWVKIQVRSGGPRV